jgi:phage terminase small subunit
MAPTRKLNRREQRYVAEYLIDLNGTEAVRRMQPKSKRPDVIAAKLHAKAHIKDAILQAMAKREERTEITQDRVLRELAAIAFSDPRQMYDARGALVSVDQMTDRAAAALAGIETEQLQVGRGKNRDTYGVLQKVKRWDKVKALELLGKHLAMWKEVHQHTGANGAPLQPPVFNFGFANGGPGDPGADK